MSKISEFFTYSTKRHDVNWMTLMESQHCRYLGKKCIKTRKSEPEISIGTCTVNYGQDCKDVIICPFRLLERRQIFMDCIHLLTAHEPGNELHIIPEVSIPGGNVDYFLVSTSTERKVKDFIGIEIQTLDTTGTVWPERQRFLKEKGFETDDRHTLSKKPFGMNWKMTAKTILIQIHHKINTFEHLNKHLVLVTQDCLIDYIKREFTFSDISVNPKIGDSMHFHSYTLKTDQVGQYKIGLSHRYSTDREGISVLLGLQAESKLELEQIIQTLEYKIGDATLFTI